MRRETGAGDPGIGVYFWPLNTAASNLPAAVSAIADGQAAPKYFVTNSNATGNDLAELNKWGRPSAFFANVANSSASAAALATGDGPVCQMQNFFGEHEIIINLSLCGIGLRDVWVLGLCGEVQQCFLRQLCEELSVRLLRRTIGRSITCEFTTMLLLSAVDRRVCFVWRSPSQSWHTS